MGNRIKPEWLRRFLEVKFFQENDSCSVKGHNSKTMYCIPCKDGPICCKCWKNSHEGHQILRVYKCQGEVAVRKNDITKYFEDVNGIQPYSRNSKVVFLLNQKGKKSENNCPKCSLCEGCIKYSYYKFCSIQCKAKFSSGNQEVDQARNSVASSSDNQEVDHTSKSKLPSSNIQENQVQVEASKRKRRRS